MLIPHVNSSFQSNLPKWVFTNKSSISLLGCRCCRKVWSSKYPWVWINKISWPASWWSPFYKAGAGTQHLEGSIHLLLFSVGLAVPLAISANVYPYPCLPGLAFTVRWLISQMAPLPPHIGNHNLHLVFVSHFPHHFVRTWQICVTVEERCFQWHFLLKWKCNSK